MKIYVRADDSAETLFNAAWGIRGDKAKTCPDLDVLEIYMYDPDEYVRRCLAENPALTPEMLDYLSHDDDPSVRVAVARHPNTTLDTLRILAGDKYIDVCRTVAQRDDLDSNILEQLSYVKDYATKRAVLENWNTDIAVYHRLLNDDDSDIRFLADLYLNYRTKRGDWSEGDQ